MEHPYMIALMISAVLGIFFAAIRLFVLADKKTAWKPVTTVLIVFSAILALCFSGMIESKNVAHARLNGRSCEQKIDELKIYAQKATVTVINSSEQPIRYIDVSSVYFKNSILELPSKRGYRFRLPYGNDEPIPRIVVRYKAKEIVLDLHSCNPSFSPTPIGTDP